MKISDDIREWCDDAYSGRKIRTTKDLYAIADLIDREMVELPKDADDVPIHAGDTVWGCRSHVKMDIAALRIEDSGWAVYVDGGKCRVDALDVSHERPDSWGLIADDLDEVVDAAGQADGVCERLAGIADRIRKLAEKEGQR